MFKTIESRTVLLFIIILIGTTYSVSGVIDPIKYISGGVSILSLVYYLVFLDKWKGIRDLELQTRIDEIIFESEKVITELNNNSIDQQMMIKNYETLLDDVTTKIECNCGETTFEGLFAPNYDNYVTCDKCGHSYRINLSINSILLSDPPENFTESDNLS